MAETRYPYTKSPRNEGQLTTEITALALPGFLGLAGSGTTVECLFADALSAPNEVILASAVVAHVPTGTDEYDSRFRTNYIVVRALNYFPTPVAGVITLADDTCYEINGTIDIGANRIECGTRNILKGVDRSNDKIISTTTGALITCDSTTVAKSIVTLESMTLQCTTGSLFAITGTLTNPQNLVVLSCTVTGFLSLGTLATCNAIVWRNSTIGGPITTGGFTITGTGSAASFFLARDCSLRGCAGTMFAFGTSVWGVIQFGRNIVTTAGGETFLSGTTGGANVTGAGKLSENVFTGAGTFISTLTNADAGWTWNDNAGITNTGLSGSSITSGTVAIARIASGTPDGTKFVRDDGTLAVPAGGGGGGSPTYTAFTQDLGAARRSGTFDITGLSGLTADKPVAVMQSAAPIASKGDSRDEPEMDHISATGYVLDATTIRVYWHASAVVVGTYAFAYMVGA